MVWVAAFAVWSGVVGLIVAAITGDTLDAGDSVSVGVSALFYVALSAVPTISALVFNDWARDGFPTRAERQSRAARPRAAVSRATTVVEAAELGSPAAAAVPAPAPSPAPPPSPGPVSAPAGGARTGWGTERGAGPRMPAPLGMPAPAATPARTDGGFPVAPLLRDVSDR